MSKNKMKLVITINSLLPKGFIGWPLIAYTLLKKYNGKVYINKRNESDIIKNELINRYKDISHCDIINSLDSDNPNLIFISLEPSSETSIPEIKGRIYSAICGPKSLNWSRQVKISSLKKVDGIFSELLPDEIDKSISGCDFKFFYDKSIFIPPILEFDLNSKTNQIIKNTLLLHESNINDNNNYSFIKNNINVINKFNINAISLNKYYDYNDLVLMLVKHHHIYNTVSYPQLNLLIVFYAQSKISHINASTDSINRYILFKIYNELLINYKNPTKFSLRVSLSNLMKPNLENNSHNVQLGNLLSCDNLILLVESFTEIINTINFPKTNEINELNDTIFFSHLKNKLDFKDYLYREFQFKNLFEHHNLHHFLISTQRNSLDHCIKPCFIRYLSNQNYSFYIQNIFNILFDTDHELILNICISTDLINQNLVFKLIFNRLLLLENKEISSESWLILSPYFKSINRNESFYNHALVWNLKFMLLTKEKKPSKSEINLIQNKISILCWIIYDLTEEEMLFSKFRSNGQYFLDFITNICGDKLFNATRNNLPPLYFPAILSEHNYILDFINDKHDSKKFSQHTFLELAITALLFSGNFVFFKKMLGKHTQILETYKPQNFNQLINYLILCGIFQHNTFFTNALDSLFSNFNINDIIFSSKYNCIKLFLIANFLGINNFKNRINYLSSFYFCLLTEDEVSFNTNLIFLNDDQNAHYSKRFIDFIN